MERITWPVVAIIGLILATILALVGMGADLGDIGQLFTLLGLGSGLGVLMGIRDHVNGNTRELMRQNAEQSKMLAKAPPVSEE